MQEGDNAATFELTEAPFQLETQVQLPCSLRFECNATLSEAVDADKRSIHFKNNFDLKPSGRLRSTSKPLEVVHTFVTQVSKSAVEHIPTQPTTSLEGDWLSYKPCICWLDQQFVCLTIS